LIGKECFGGLDLAAVGDYTAFVLEFNEGDKTQVLVFCWIPEDKYKNRKDAARENANIDHWVSQGFVKITPGNVTDYDIIHRDIVALASVYQIKSIGYDPWNATQLISNLLSDGLPMDGFTQTLANFSPPTKEFERMLRLGKYEHYNNPVLRWMLSNVVVYRDGNGNLRPDKRRSAEKIDAVIAAIMAHGEFMSAKSKSGTQSIYETRGLLGSDDTNETDDGKNNN
ncbi:MAG: terminase TerL endonuclease subunit, partial [Alistipes sp.]